MTDNSVDNSPVTYSGVLRPTPRPEEGNWVMLQPRPHLKPNARSWRRWAIDVAILGVNRQGDESNG